MTLCPIAIVAGCKKCPAFAICPLKSTLGDYVKEEETKPAAARAKGRAGAKPGKKK
jgi:hypothetical protein